MSKSGNILCAICARGGSKRIKGKNIRPLLGKPLIAYTIEQALRWGKAMHVIVSTDSEEIAGIAKRYGAETPFIRPVELAGDNVGKLDVLRHALSEAEAHYDARFDILLDLDATAPIRSVKDIDNIVKLFKGKKTDCVFSVVKARRNPYFNMVEKHRDGTVKVCKKAHSTVLTSQSAPSVYEMNASMYVYSRDFLLDPANKTPYSKTSYAYEMDEIAGVDIDSEIDFKFIEFLVKEGVVKL